MGGREEERRGETNGGGGDGVFYLEEGVFTAKQFEAANRYNHIS